MSNDHIIAGINVDLIGKGRNREEIQDSIVTVFNKIIKRLLVLLVSKIDDADDNKYVQLAKSNLMWGDKYIPTAFIEKTYKYMLEPVISDHIVERDWSYFHNKNYDKYMGNAEGEVKDAIDFFMGFIKSTFHYLTDKEKDHIWELINVMLFCAIEYDDYTKHY